MSARKTRVEQALRDTLAELIAREVKDPRVTGAGMVSVTRVECNVDLSVARVYISIFGPEAAAERAVAGLQAAAGFLRGPAGRALNMRHPPELRFLRDSSPEVSLQLAEIIREDEAKAKAVGRVPGEAPPDDATAKPAAASKPPRARDDDSDADDSASEPTRDLGSADEEPTADLHPASPADDEPALEDDP